MCVYIYTHTTFFLEFTFPSIPCSSTVLLQNVSANARNVAPIHYPHTLYFLFAIVPGSWFTLWFSGRETLWLFLIRTFFTFFVLSFLGSISLSVYPFGELLVSKTTDNDNSDQLTIKIRCALQASTHSYHPLSLRYCTLDCRGKGWITSWRRS